MLARYASRTEKLKPTPSPIPMAELQHLVEGHQTNGGFIPPAIAIPEAPETSAAVSAGVSVGSKRLRRPSVRLGDIGGDQYQQVTGYDSQIRRPKWRPTASNNRKETNPQSGKSSRTRTLTNLGSGYENTGTLDEDPIAIGSWRVKNWVKSSGGETTTTTKRARSNWATKDGGEGEEEEEDEELGEGFRDFSREESESPMKEQTQDNQNEREGFKNRRRYENNREIEVSGDWHSGGGGRGREGVKIWLQELGLGRYWPMFEMHEVDEEVLPLLTLEDLKDMGINAVGSRRKMYCAIQKLGREFS